MTPIQDRSGVLVHWSFASLGLLALSFVLVGPQRIVDAQPPKFAPVAPGRRAPFDVAFTPRADRVAVHCGDPLPLFHFPSMKPWGKVDRKCGYSSMAFSPCGRFLATNGPDCGTVQLWDVESNPAKLERVLRPTQEKKDPLNNAMLQLVFSEDGGHIIGVDDVPNVVWWEWKKDRQAKLEVSFGGQLTMARLAGHGVLTGITPTGGLRVFRLQKQEVRPIATIPDAGLNSQDGVYYVTPDGRTAVIWKRRTEAVELYEFGEAGTRLLHTTMALAGQTAPGTSLSVEDIGVSGDRSLLVVSYGKRLKEEGCFTYLAFFPRTKERAAELGLDPKRHTYALLKVETGDYYEPPLIRFSPDGNWFIFIHCDFLDNIFWEVSRVGEILRADKRVERR